MSAGAKPAPVPKDKQLKADALARAYAKAGETAENQRTKTYATLKKAGRLTPASIAAAEKAYQDAMNKAWKTFETGCKQLDLEVAAPIS